MKKALIVICLFCFVQRASSQIKPIVDRKGVAVFCENFMQKFVDKKIDSAFQYLKIYSVIEPEEIDKLTVMLKRQLELLGDSYGNIISFGFIDEKSVKEFLIKRTYMLLFEKSCLKFDFRFYNNGSGWTVNHFNFTADLEQFFE